jgi:molybdopterin molybdotransferase
VEVIPAGIPPMHPITRGTCAQIMTGAIIPEGADTVIKVEESSETSEVGTGKRTVKFNGAATSPNICFRGEDIKAGQVVLEAGTLLDTRHVPILATIGAVFVDVYRMPSVGILSTGTELVEPGKMPGVSQIRNSNAYQGIAQLGRMGIDCDYYGIAPDDQAVTRNMIREVLDNNDIVILSGGVSMGEFDFVPSVLISLGIDIRFREMAIQPGKPTLFGTGSGKFVFGLPGNPVSSYFILELLVKPFIYRCMSHNWHPPLLRLPTGEIINRRHSHRLSWIPVRLDDNGQVRTIEYHGSADIFSLRDAFGIISIPIGVNRIEKGQLVDVRPI